MAWTLAGMRKNQLHSGRESAPAGSLSSSQEANLKSTGHYFFFIPNEFSKQQIENHKLFLHREMVQSKGFF